MDQLDPLTQPLSAHPLLSQSDPTTSSASLPASIPYEPQSTSTQATQTSVSAFAAAQELVARSSSTVTYEEAPPYVPPRPLEGSTPPTGKLGDGRWTILGDGQTTLDPKAKVVGRVYKSEDIAKLSVSELKKRGLGRVPSGELPRRCFV